MSAVREALLGNAQKGDYSTSDVARTLGMSVRSLGRLLAAEGLQAQSALEDLRRAYAVELLRDARLSTEHIAERLGYADERSFRRAFERWTGMSRLVDALPHALDGLAVRRKGIAALLVVLGAVPVTVTARLSAFMGDAARSELSVLPTEPFLVHHSCLSAYVEAAALADDRVPNLYDMARWPDLNGTRRTEAGSPGYEPFNLDAFAYPPPSLLLPKVALAWLPDFATQRAFWFALNGLLVAAGLWVVARWCGGPARRRALLLAPAIWISVPTLATLQVGNVHLAVMVAAMLALVAFERGRPALGGALLAFAVLSKAPPGLLVVVPLVRRRFREVLWTTGWAAGFTALGLLVFGADPFIQFVQYELPRLSSGEALAFLDGPESVAINLAPFGVPFKLAALGVHLEDPWALARPLNTGITGLLAVVAAWRDRGGPRHPGPWPA